MAQADDKGWIHFTGKKPDGGDGQEFRLPSRHVLHWRTKGHERKLFEVFSIEPVLQSPLAIFEGLEREEFEDGFCYCGIPDKKQVTENSTVPPPPGMVFLIFVNKEFAIFEFRWEKMCAEDFGNPENYKTRFKQKTWSP
jgi:hypothetical protein